MCHRRAGKTVSCCVDLLIGAMECGLPNPQFAYLAPFRDQAKKVAWEYLKDLSKDYWAAKPNESELVVSVRSKGGVAKIFLGGADNPDTLRGMYFDGVVMDEVGDMRPSSWYSVLRPALADRKGWAIFAGTPKGRNLFWNLREEARLNPETHMLLEVKASESGLLDADELRDARIQMTEDTYLREFECSFDASVPGAYFAGEIGKLYEGGQVGEFPADGELEVEVVGDLGFTDSCSWWVWQTLPDGYRVVDFYESDGRPIDHYIDWIEGLPYRVKNVWLPHDAKAKSLQTGRSMVERFLDRGIVPQMVPNLGLQDGIEAARQVLKMCWFNEPRVYVGLDHLRAYSREWDERAGVYKNKPKHDSHSHASDAFRYMALSTKGVGKRMSVGGGEVGRQMVEGANYGFSLDDIWDCTPQSSRRI